MTYVTDKDYAKLAEAVADDLLNNAVPLNDSISKLAQDMGLNQEQVRRLCEATNNTTFNKLFQKKEAADDRIVEFKVASAKDVLGDAIKTAAYQINGDDVALMEMRHLVDEMSEIRNPETPTETTKVAFELRRTSKPSEEVDRRTLHKVLSHMRHEKLAADMQYTDSLTELRGRFKRIYDAPPFETFEKQAVALFSMRATAPLQDLRMLMRLPAVEYDYSLITKTAGFVDDTSVEVQMFSNILKLAQQRNKLARGIAELEQIL